MKVLLLGLGLVLLLCLVAVGLGGQVLPLGSIPIGGAVMGNPQVDSQMPGNTGVTTTTSPWTWSFTNAAGGTLYLFVTIDGALTTPTATYNGVAMMFLGNRFTGNAGALYLFMLAGPATGAHNFVITWPTGTQTAIAAAISFRNAMDQTSPTVNACNLNPGGGGACVNASNFPLSSAGTRSGNVMLQAVCYGDAGHSTQSGNLSALLEVNGASFCNNMELQWQVAVDGTTTSSFANSVVTSYATLGISVIGTGAPISPMTPLSFLPNNCANTLGGTVASSVSCTWNVTPFAGTNIVCSGSTWNSGSTVTGLSISDGTPYTSSNAGGSSAFQYATNKWIIVAFLFGGTPGATVTMTIAGTDANADLVCSAFNDNVGGVTADGTCTGSTNTTTATLSCSSPITTTGTDFIYGHIAAGGTFPTITSGWQLGSFERGSTSANLVQGVASSVNPLFNTPTAGQQAGIIGLAIKP